MVILKSFNCSSLFFQVFSGKTYSKDWLLFKNLEWWGSKWYFKPKREKLYSNLNEEQNLTEAAKFLYIFLTTLDKVDKYVEIMQSNSSDNCAHCYNIEILNLFHSELQLIDTNSTTENKVK